MFCKNGVPSHILYFGDSLGDNLLLTTLSKALYERGYQNIWIKCDHPDLFKNNPVVKLVIPFNTLLSSYLLKLGNVKLVRPAYTTYQPEEDRDLIPEKHILLKMADWLDIKGTIENKPVLDLEVAETAKGLIYDKQIVIVTSTVSALIPMKNKEWFAGRYQQIVDKYANQYQFIQLGSKYDAPLTNVLDLRGKTTIRESAAILKNARLLITHVGFMMHLARAVDCRAVIIYGGRESPDQSGYSVFRNIYSEVACSPCWFHNKCEHDRKCLTRITSSDAEHAVLEQLQLYGTPLTTDLLINI
ncbi:glycosyltransferase family 9 protein [Mucilaginibacter corticis]|uniref:Glycosyltransferase family 9 protein n=1 Tax=Mucilaginibacter corticis TaxID=2597670 RepID=A0A556M7S8_9SPHI|nr:glycosyltransferase family 9 protein [Mucilaginibacter corticis]TSJ35968.1 glycosyltransferase family 9 protein [Mucilaginibacter corticis]